MNDGNCRFAHRSLAILWLAVSFTGAAGAEGGVTVRPALGATPAAPAMRRDGESVRLRLDEAIAVALERNLGLQVERFNVAAAGHSLEQNRGIFDAVATAALGADSSTSPTASNLAGADVIESKGQRWDFGLSQLLASGGTVAATWNNSRTETNSFFATLNPSYSVGLDVTLSQPLLRDLGSAQTTRGIRIARTNRAVSQENFRVEVTAVARQVEDAYWALVEAIEQAVVAEESLKLARQLHEQNRIKVEVGTLAPLELVQSEAGVATREEELIRARAAIGDREDALRQLLNTPAGDLWQARILPETAPEMEPAPIDPEADTGAAVARRPELKGRRLQLANLEIEAAYYRNQKLPRLDLQATYGFNGLGGDVTQRDFFTGEILFQEPGDYQDALDQITGLDFDGWSAAINFAYPIQNRAARARSALADVDLERARTELADTELAVTTQVRRLGRAVQTAAQVIASATVSRRLEERNLEAEQKRYENGMSTSFQILQIQEDLTEAKSRLVAAKTTYRRALASYYEAAGSLLDHLGIQIAEP